MLQNTLHKKMRFSIEDFFSKCDHIRSKTKDLVTFTEKILNEKPNFLYSDIWVYLCILWGWQFKGLI